MNQKEKIDSLGIIIENDLVERLKLIKETSYGILSHTAMTREISRFKSQVLRSKENFRLVSAFSDDELDVIIKYILLRDEIRVNEKDLNKIPEEPDEKQI